MPYKLWEFVKRHKKKLIFTGVVVAGGRFAYRYAARKLSEFQEKEAAECLVQARRQHHFDNNQRTCNMTVISMLPTLRERLAVLLNTEEMTELLKTNPSNKIQLWEDLKLLSFTRVISVVYSCTMMCLLLRVQLHVIGGYMYVENATQHENIKTNTVIPIKPTAVQERYLDLIREFFDKGIQDLVAKVQDAVFKETSSLSLKERLSISNIETLVTHIRERVENGGQSSGHGIPSMPLSKYLLDWNPPIQAETNDHEILYTKLLQETQDILESQDFHTVLETGLNRGFARLIDYLADFYKLVQKSDSVDQNFHEVAIPIAKLIPLLSGLLHKLGSDAPNPLVQELLMLEQTKTLAANIYEAFSQTETEIEDQQFAP